MPVIGDSPNIQSLSAWLMAALVRVAQACRRFGQRIQHRLQIEGRAADDLEHIGGGGLLL